MPLHTALLRSILLDAWLIDPAYAESMLPKVLEWMDGNHTKLFEQHERPVPTLLADAGHIDLRSSDGSFSGFTHAGTGSALIPIRGAITKYDGWCNYGVETYSQWIDEAERSTNIENIILLIDSPGGQANASFLLAERISRLQKPVVAYVDAGMAASGAYLILSAADSAYAATPVDMFGSIGAMISITDYKNQLEGSKTWEIYSRLSSEKNASWRRLKENNDPSLIQDMLDINVQHFIGTVKKNRGEKIRTTQYDPFKGATYTADVALSIGLIDGIGTLDQAISLAKSKQTNNMSWKTKLANWLMSQPDETEDPLQDPAETTADDPGSSDPANQGDPAPTLEGLQTQIGQLTSQNQTLTTENTRLQGEVTSLKTKLAAKPAAAPTAPVVAKEEIPEPPKGPEPELSTLSETDLMMAQMRGKIKSKA